MLITFSGKSGIPRFSLVETGMRFPSSLDSVRKYGLWMAGQLAAESDHEARYLPVD